MSKPMAFFQANPGMFIFGVVALVAVLTYFGWGALDRIGIATEQGTATVTGKHYNPPGATYRTVISGGRAWTLSDATNDSYILLLDLNGQAFAAVVDKATHAAVAPGDKVRVQYQRKRFSGQLEVTRAER